ncbi:MAG TPA: hypothetical protein VG935_01455 [Patescibacteria group bacterium]|nr:hypothetical protein [Patescibacteria group bacterium]
MPAYLFFPFIFLGFWYIHAPLLILEHFQEINRAFFQLFSTPLLLRTFFRPIKNEYRQGLVGFSIGMGIVLKSIVILVSLVLFVPLILFELLCLLGFLALPIFTFAIVLWR